MAGDKPGPQRGMKARSKHPSATPQIDYKKIAHRHLREANELLKEMDDLDLAKRINKKLRDAYEALIRG